MDRFSSKMPEPVKVAYCDDCKLPIYVGHGVTAFMDGAIVHDECESDYVTRSYVNIRGIASKEGSI